MIALVAGICKNGELGKAGKLCVKSKVDMKRFRDLTLHQTVVMGSNTYWSIPHALPDRENIVISRRIRDLPDAKVIHDATAFFRAARVSTKVFYVIGGGELYRQALPYAKLIYLTEFPVEDSDADTFFPVDEMKKDFEVAFADKAHDSELNLDMLFATYRRKNTTENK